MTIWMIWACLSEDTGDVTLVEAWDDDTVSENAAGWAAARTKAEQDHGARNIRITSTTVNIDAVRDAFLPVAV
jgi:hypothetical protein